MSPIAALRWPDGVADRRAHGLQAGHVGVLQVRFVASRHEQQLERRATPERGDAHDVVVGEHHPLVGGQLGLDRGADHAPAGEAGERPLLVEDLAGHERQPENLGVRVRQRRAGLAAVVDDHLAVAHLGGRGVGGEAALQRVHHLGGLLVVELVEAAVVVRRVDEHLVDPAGLGGDVDRADVVDHEARLAVERRVAGSARRGCASPSPSSTVSNAGREASSLPGQNGHGRSGSDST